MTTKIKEKKKEKKKKERKPIKNLKQCEELGFSITHSAVLSFEMIL